MIGVIGKRLCGWAFLVSLLAGSGVAAAEEIGRFSSGDLTGWTPKSFVGETSYRLVEENGVLILEAASEGAASGLFFERDIDLAETPILTWRWRVSAPVNPPDERSREGDDFAVRIYFVAPGEGWLSLPQSVAYVWASRQPEGSSWPNPYTGNVRMIAVDSGDRRAGEWRVHRRNMREDFKKLFGRDIRKITHVALMTDTDNSGLSARGWYGDISVEPADR